MTKIFNYLIFIAMPIYLPPISRRRFLARSLTAAAALGLAPGCAAFRGKRDPQSLALLSDIHIAADPLKLGRSINMTDHLKQVSAEVIAWPQLPGTVFVNGDLAFNNGQSDDYAAVLGLLQPLREAGLPIHLNLGNHDEREHFWESMPTWKTIPKNLPGRQASIVRLQDANWFLLDSLIKTLTTPGMLGDEQRAWLANALDANKDKPAMIMIHHQPGPLAPGKPGGGLEDAEQLMALLRSRPQVKAYFFGHTHRWEASRDKSGIHLINLPTVAYVFDEGQPNGWVHATTRADGISLELRCLDTAHPKHGEVVNLDWGRA